MNKSYENKLGSIKEKLNSLIEEMIYLHLKDKNLLNNLFPDFKKRFLLIVDIINSDDNDLIYEYKMRILKILKEIRDYNKILFIRMKNSFDEHEKANIISGNNKINNLEVALSEICLIFNNFSEIAFTIDKLIECYFSSTEYKPICTYHEYFNLCFSEIFLSDELVQVSILYLIPSLFYITLLKTKTI